MKNICKWYEKLTKNSKLDREKTNKQTNKKQQQKWQEKKIHHRIHKDKGNTMIYKKICLTFKNRKKMRRAHQTFRPSTGVLSSYIWRIKSASNIFYTLYFDTLRSYFVDVESLAGIVASYYHHCYVINIVISRRRQVLSLCWLLFQILFISSLKNVALHISSL